MAVVIQENIFRFTVPIHDAHFVQAVQPQKNLEFAISHFVFFKLLTHIPIYLLVYLCAVKFGSFQVKPRFRSHVVDVKL